MARHGEEAGVVDAGVFLLLNFARRVDNTVPLMRVVPSVIAVGGRHVGLADAALSLLKLFDRLSRIRVNVDALVACDAVGVVLQVCNDHAANKTIVGLGLACLTSLAPRLDVVGPVHAASQRYVRRHADLRGVGDELLGALAVRQVRLRERDRVC